MVSAGTMLQRAGVLASMALSAPLRRGLVPPAARAALPVMAAPALGVFAQRELSTALDRRTALATPAKAHASLQRGKGSALAARKFSGSSAGPKVISIDELKRRMEEDTVLLIDVREPEEIMETGELAHAGLSAINVPLTLILDEPNVLAMNPEEFEDEFGERLPTKSDDGRALVFSCRSGVRAGNAAAFAESLGFKNVYNYKGSALEWFA